MMGVLERSSTSVTTEPIVPTAARAAKAAAQTHASTPSMETATMVVQGRSSPSVISEQIAPTVALAPTRFGALVSVALPCCSCP